MRLRRTRRLGPRGSHHRVRLGQGEASAFPGVDVGVESAVSEYVEAWGKAALSKQKPGPHAAEEVQDALIALESMVNMLWGAGGQLEQTQRNVGTGARNRHRRLVQAAGLLLDTFFTQAKDAQGQPLDWRSILPLPHTSIGPQVFRFGAVKLPDGMSVAGASALTAPLAMDAADLIIEAATDVRDRAFQAQEVEQGIPLIPSAQVLKTLSDQSSIIKSNVFTVGASGLKQMCGAGFGGNMGWNLPREQAQAEMAVHGADALEEESELYWGRFGATLTSAVRRSLPKRAFALPSQRKYPVMSREPMRPSGTLIPSRGHAIAAKGRALTALRDGRIDRGQYERIIRRADGVLRGMADE